MKKLLSLLFAVTLVMSLGAAAFAETYESEEWNEWMEASDTKVIDGYIISIGDEIIDVEELAHENDVDPDELLVAILAGPGADGKYSPFSSIKQLGNMSLEEKIARTKATTIENKNFGKPPLKPKDSAYITRCEQASKAYAWAINNMANGQWSYIGVVAPMVISLNIAVDAIVSQTGMEEITITAKDAAKIGVSFASKFIDEPLLFHVNSTDYSGSPSIELGIDGKYRAWNVFIGDKVGTKKMTFWIVDNKIEGYTYDDINNYEEDFYLTQGTYALSDINIDSDEAVGITIKEKGLKPGGPEHLENWYVGYYYVISGEGGLVINISGISPNGNPANVKIDQKTGEIIYSIERVSEDQHGPYTWAAF